MQSNTKKIGMPTDVKSLAQNKQIVVIASNCRRKNGTRKMTEITTTKLYSYYKIFAYILDWRTSSGGGMLNLVNTSNLCSLISICG